ncbi:MAG: cell division protein FtsA [Bacteroidales bacterium]|nr:cell division protein FtsA [Bacteroidales bacterium]
MEQEQKQTIDPAKMFAAIDVGTTKIVALVGYKNEKGKIVVCGKSNVPSSGLWCGEVAQVSIAAKSVKLAVEKAEKEAGFFPKKVVVGVAGKHIRAQHFSVPKNRDNAAAEITQEELDELKKNAKNIAISSEEEIINVVLQNYMLDGNPVVEPLGMTNCCHIDANYQIVVGKVQALMQLRQCIQMAGLEIAEGGLYLEPLASADAVLKEEEKNLGVALIDIGGGTTDIAIYKDNILKATSVVPFGGNLISSDIKTYYGLLENYAEELKIQHGEAIKDFAPKNVIVSIAGIAGQPNKDISVSHLAGIIQARVEEILDSALFEIGMSGYQKQLAAGVVVTGGGSKLKNLSQLVSYKLLMNSKISSPIESVIYNDNTFFNDPIFSTSVGLLMRASSIHELAAKKAELQEEKKEEAVIVDEPETIPAGEESNTSNEETTEREKAPSFWGKALDSAKKQLKDIFMYEDN